MANYLPFRPFCLLILCAFLGRSLGSCNNERQPTPPTPGEQFRFAVVSDFHFGRTDATDKVIRTLKNIQSSGIALGALVVVGDLTDAGSPAAASYDQAVRTVQANLPNVPVMYLMGEQDRTTDPSAELFRSKTGQEPNQYLEVGGYPFVGVSVDGSAPNGANCYASATKTFLADKLAFAAQKFPGKPIFVFYHIPVSSTVWGTSIPNDFASSALESTMNLYPQAVAFSGHTHYPLGDERSVHQRKFTSINTSGNAYGLLPYGIETAPEDLYRPRGSAEVTEALIVSVDADHNVSIERLDTFYGTAIKTPWRVRAPHDGTQFTYTDARTGGAAPTFAPGAAVAVGNVGQYGCTVSFPQASDDDMVYSYRVDIVRTGTGKTVQTLRLGSQFWNTVHMPSSVSWNVTKLNAGVTYQVQVWAEDSWGQSSATPIASEPFTTR